LTFIPDYEQVALKRLKFRQTRQWDELSTQKLFKLYTENHTVQTRLLQ